MKGIAKKIIVYSLLVGIAQFGLSAATIEASPRGDWHQQRQENYRHDRAMQRHENEQWQHWNNRQWRENQRHEHHWDR